MFELLFEKFDEKIQLTDEEKQLCKTFFIPKKLRKKQYLLQEGDVCKYGAFVEKGFLRCYTTDDKGNEHMLQFAFEGWWMADQYSFLTNTPSRYNIDAMEDCELLLITRDAEEKMMQTVPKLERYFRVLLQNSLIATIKRLESSLSDTAEERYNRLLKNCPTVAERVPQHMLASAIGITPETLSRIRKQMSLRKSTI